MAESGQKQASEANPFKGQSQIGHC
jgi:hypothetical protein